MLFNRPRFMYSPDDNGGGTADSGKSSNDDLIAKLTNSFNSIAQKQGGQDAAGVLLLQENKGYRDEIRQLKSDLEAAKAKTPADGSTILTPEQTAVWQAYQELGKPDDLKAQATEYSQMKRETIYRELAEAHNLNYDAVRQLPGIDAFEFEATEVEQDGEKRKAFVAKNGDGQGRPFSEVIDEKWAVFKPALVKEAESQQPQYTPFVRQAISGKPAKSDAIGNTLNKKYAPRNVVATQEK